MLRRVCVYGEGWGDSLQLKNGRIGGVLTPFISKIGKSLFFKKCVVSEAVIPETT